MLKKLGARLGLWLVVFTRDHDGEVRTRIVHDSEFGGGRVKGLFGPQTNWGKLEPDGSISGHSYMVAWKNYTGNRNPVEFAYRASKFRSVA
jgi:hypothetical protein